MVVNKKPNVRPDKVFLEGLNSWEIYKSSRDVSLVRKVLDYFEKRDRVQATLVNYFDNSTGTTTTTLHTNPELRSGAYVAWLAARQSRAGGSPLQIALEMGLKGVNPDEKLEETFTGYGHGSVADAAEIMIQFDNAPLHLPMILFNEGVINSGQEKSTRYQSKFGKANLHPLSFYLENVPADLEKEYQNLGVLSLKYFNEHKVTITQAYEEFYKPSTKQKSSLDSRVLDTVRFYLLLGQNTGFAYATNARDWGKSISHLKSSESKFYRNTGQQIETMLAPSSEVEKTLGFLADAPSLVRHTEADNILKNNLNNLRVYMEEKGLSSNFRDTRSKPELRDQDVEMWYSLSDEKLAVQYIMAAYPGTDLDKIRETVSKFTDDDFRDISKIIYHNHNKYKEMPGQIATPSDLTFVVKGALGELRDFNRQRAWGRFMPDIPLFNGAKTSYEDASKIVNKGWSQTAYLTDVDAFKNENNKMIDNFNNYYSHLVNFMNSAKKIYGNDVDWSFITNTLPLAHQSDLIMHGDPKQASYMTHLRVKPGGHQNYRKIAFKANELMKDLHPIYSAMGDNMGNRPDSANRDQFFDRS